MSDNREHAIQGTLIYENMYFKISAVLQVNILGERGSADRGLVIPALHVN